MTHAISFEDVLFDSLQKSNAEHDSGEVKKIEKKLSQFNPSMGSPFKFYEWFFKEGFEDYHQYFRWAPNFFQDWEVRYEFNEKKFCWIVTNLNLENEENTSSISQEITIADDLGELFEVQFQKVVKIYTARWDSVTKKQEFLNQLKKDYKLLTLIKIDTRFRLVNTLIKQESQKNLTNFFECLKRFFLEKTNRYFTQTQLSFLNKIVVPDGPKERKATSQMTINSKQAGELFNFEITENYLSIRTSFINKIGSTGSIDDLQKLFSNHKALTDNKFEFNCENGYVAFIIRWLKDNCKFTNAFTAVEQIGVFYTNFGSNKLINQNDLSSAFTQLIKDVYKTDRLSKPDRKKFERKYLNKKNGPAGLLPSELSEKKVVVEYIQKKLTQIFS